MKTIEDYIYNADGTVTIVYSDGTTSTHTQTQNQGGYTSGTGGTTGGYSNGTGKKWWEVALGVFPAILGSIFGNNQTPPPINYPYPGQGSNTASFGGMNMTIIIVAAVVVIFLLMKKK